MWMTIVAVWVVVLTLIYWTISHQDKLPDGRNWIKFVTAYVYLRWTKKKEPLFHFDIKSKDLGKVGVVSLPMACTKDNPRPLSDNIHAIDSIRMWGMNQDGVLLYIQLSRRHDRRSEVILYLRVDGRDYRLPRHPDTNVYNTDEQTFSAAGLHLEVLEPLRRWRVHYHGYLRMVSNGSTADEDKIVLVNFSFLSQPLFNYTSFPEDYDLKYLAGYLSRCDVKPWQLFEKLSVERQALFSQLHGIISVDGEKPIEVRLRGLKERTYGKLEWRKYNRLAYMEAVLHIGTSVRLFVEDSTNDVKKFVYGYVCPPCNMTVQFISDLKVDVDAICGDVCPREIDVQFTAGGCHYHLKMKSRDHPPFKTYMGEEWEAVSHVQVCDVTLNDKPGDGVIHFSSNRLAGDAGYSGPLHRRYSLPLLRQPEIHSCKELVVTFRDVRCRSSHLVGGKAASLALMTTVEASAEEKFEVPSGVSVTKVAFELQTAQNPKIDEALNSLQTVAGSSKEISTELAEECDKVVELIANAPVSPRLKEELVDKLRETFGDDFNSIKFAVRSSAIGEDGEELSAAGQNETFLGVKGLDQVCSMVSKCWASQFSFRSVEYRRQNGQLLNSGMGVVIQKMVTAHVAGVLFSRDPVTGSPANIVITSNYGLGESVVSSTADPDTITIRRSHDDQLSVQQITTGCKKSFIQMSDESGTVECETEVEAASKCSLTEELAIRLSNIALFLEKCFGNSRDIEWAIVHRDIYILQSRPVTTNSGMTDFEAMHEFDTPMKTDNEFYSTANVSEVMPGSTTALTMTSVSRGFNVHFQTIFNWRMDIYKYEPLIPDVFIYFYGHTMMNLITQKSWSLSKEKDATTKALDIGLYGRVLDDDHIYLIAQERFQIKPPLVNKLNLIALRGILFGRWLLKRMTKKFINYRVPLDGTEDIFECYERIGSVLLDITQAFDAHMSVTMVSTMWNMVTLNLLSQGSKGYSNEQFVDFAMLIGSCNGAESGNVPASLSELAAVISQAKDLSNFGKMSPQDALDSLHNSSDENVRRKFLEFVSRHGHRGLKEFDLICISWGIDPKQVVTVLQGIINTTSDTIRKPKEKSQDDVINSIKSPLSPFKKWLLRLVMKFCRTSICHREQAKSMLIKFVDGLRLAYRHLAKMMMSKGFILDENLIFFFTHEELGQFIKTRSPKLIRRAKQRQRVFRHMDKLVFPEIISGYPKPISDSNEEISAAEVEMVIKGYPVCQGTIEAKARVVSSFHDVHTIQPGEILITHATDIGWSPYFPMLAGIVTEIGGLISHGAVVAREFGLPCIVGVDNATKLFQSGDLVLLDATQGTVMKLKHTSNHVQSI